MAQRLAGRYRDIQRPLHSLALAALLCCSQQTVAEALPQLKKLRFDEDYSELANRPCPTCWPDCWKYIPLDNSARGYLTLGGEIRPRYEYTEDPNFGEAPQDKHGVRLQRYSLLGDLHWNRHVRFFGQLTSALESGRAGGPGTVHEDKLEWQNAFFDFSFQLPSERELTLRPGRQEIVLGSGRLVDAREGPNVRRTFDGARVFVTGPRWRLDFLAARPRQDRRGVFDDKTNDQFAL